MELMPLGADEEVAFDALPLAATDGAELAGVHLVHGDQDDPHPVESLAENAQELAIAPEVMQQLVELMGKVQLLPDALGITNIEVGKKQAIHKISDPERREAVRRLVESYELDHIDTRRVVLLLEYDPGLPNPAAVAMVRHIRETPIGEALARVEEAFDMLEQLPSLTPTERLTALALLEHLQKWIGSLRQRIETGENP